MCLVGGHHLPSQEWSSDKTNDQARASWRERSEETRKQRLMRRSSHKGRHWWPSEPDVITTTQGNKAADPNDFDSVNRQASTFTPQCHIFTVELQYPKRWWHCWPHRKRSSVHTWCFCQEVHTLVLLPWKSRADINSEVHRKIFSAFPTLLYDAEIWTYSLHIRVLECHHQRCFWKI